MIDKFKRVVFEIMISLCSYKIELNQPILFICYSNIFSCSLSSGGSRKGRLGISNELSKLAPFIPGISLELEILFKYLNNTLNQLLNFDHLSYNPFISNHK